MQMHELHPTTKRKKRKRIGRGGKLGTHAGRGIDGQNARAGAKLQPLVRQLIKRYPKLRGYRFKTMSRPESAVNLDVLDWVFSAGELVNPGTLVARRIVRRIAGRMPMVKILGTGEIRKPLRVEQCKASAGAKEKIEKAGGTVT